MTQFVRVVDDESDEAIEIPTEEDSLEGDGTLLLSTLVAQFPGACGMKYRSETGAMRGVRLANGSLYPPNGSWGNTVYIINYPKDSKRKVDDELDNPVSTKMKKVETKKCSDLIVLGLPWKSSEEDMEKYFKQYGELILTQVKRDPRTGQSKGFGFIRFKEYDSQLRCLGSRHRIDGRWCEVNLPNSHGEGTNMSTNRKIFVARCTEDLTVEDLREYFEDYGEVVDVFIPKPFRAFAFVTFADPTIAERMCGEDHIIKGASVHISSAEPKAKDAAHGERTGPNRGPNNRGRNSRDDQPGWGGGARQQEAMPNEPNMNNIGMNMLSSAMLAAAQAVFQGANQPNASENYQLGPGFGGTRDSRSGQSGGYTSSGGSWGGDSSQQPPSGGGYSNWGNRSGGATSGGYTTSNPSSTQWGQGAQNRSNWN